MSRPSDSEILARGESDPRLQWTIALELIRQLFVDCLTEAPPKYDYASGIRPYAGLAMCDSRVIDPTMFSSFRIALTAKQTDMYFPVPGAYEYPDGFMNHAWQCGQGEFYLWRKSGEYYHQGLFGRGYYYTNLITTPTEMTTYYLDRVFVGKNSCTPDAVDIQRNLESGWHSLCDGNNELAIPQQSRMCPFLSVTVVP
jgi:hypothetical protein